jgi:hypothetical protein
LVYVDFALFSSSCEGSPVDENGQPGASVYGNDIGFWRIFIIPASASGL